jgi:hypothetical protein
MMLCIGQARKGRESRPLLIWRIRKTWSCHNLIIMIVDVNNVTWVTLSRHLQDPQVAPHGTQAPKRAIMFIITHCPVFPNQPHREKSRASSQALFDGAIKPLVAAAGNSDCSLEISALPSTAL